ncbi:hypothetical protein [Sphingobacterium sp. LRF_L2]|uniref:hypothetical protein n=1 Tax=Sphingobacterium sp. LRF_L2 TaxID=3369421 RepID=UPI003F61196E
MLEMLPETITEDVLYFLIIGIIIRLIIWILFAYTLYTTLRLVKKTNQCILPNQAWFIAVPFFNIYWNFEVVRRLTDSLNNEFYDRKIEVEEQPTRKWGMLFAWTFLLSNIPLPVFILTTIAILHLVYFITYWVKVNQYKTLLKLHVRKFGKGYIAQNEQYEN